MIGITGGSGYIGGSLAQRLMKIGKNVQVVDLVRPNYPIKQFVIADVRKYDEIHDCLKGCNCVYHLAAIVSKLRGQEDRWKCISINVSGTLNVLEACRKHDIKRVVHVSTSEVLGDPLYLPTDEKHPRNPKTTYGITKCCAEDLCREYARTYGLQVVIPRLYMIYGEQDFRELKYHSAIAKFVWLVLNNTSPIVYEGCSRTWLHIDDCVDALLLLKEKGRCGEIYDITAPPSESISMFDLAEKIIGIYGKDLKPTLEQPPIWDTKIKMPSGEKAYSELHWKPHRMLTNELHGIIEGWKKHLSVS